MDTDTKSKSDQKECESFLPQVSIKQCKDTGIDVLPKVNTSKKVEKGIDQLEKVRKVIFMLVAHIISLGVESG